MSGPLKGRVSRANVVILLLIAALGLLSIDWIGERLVPPLYDAADSFIRVDPKPGWIATSIVIEQNRPVGIVSSGRVATPRLKRLNSTWRPLQVPPDGAAVPELKI